MPLMTFQKCWRGRDDCVSFQAIEGIPPNLTEEQLYNFDFEPVSFVCCGCIKQDYRSLPQDAYRICFKNDVVDEMSDNDEQDLSHLVQVIASAQAVISSRRLNQERVMVPTDDGAWTEVETMQFKSKS